ncbi:MAG: hypothetical protein QM760_01450 [Nibricoccus sp.]
MRFLPCFVLAALTAVVIRAEIPPLLDDAWIKYVGDIDYWAYTETVRALDEKGQVTRETATRYDPSKPYAEQFTVLSHTGKQSIEVMQKWARQRGIDRGNKLERPGGVESDALPRVVLMGSRALADLEHATVVEENEQSITYLIPLHPEDGKASMVEKFETRVRVSKTLRAFERVDISLSKPVRVKVVAKINKIALSIDFATIDPAFGPAATIFKDHATISAFFKKREGGHESVRSDFKRVKPYRERFSVEIGPSRTIDF